MTGDKKKSPITFFLATFVAIVVLVLIVNRKSGLTYEVRFPLNNGVAYLSTLTDHLVAVSHDDKVYVWDWDSLSAKPGIVDAQSDQAVLLESGSVISVRQSNARKIVVAELEDGKVYREIPISAEDKQVRLAISRSGGTVVVMLADVSNRADSGDQEVMLVDCEAGLVRPIVELAEATGDRIMGLAVSDDGGLVALAGEKDGQGYVVMVNIEQKRVAWTQTLSDLQKVRNAVFSADGKVIYIRGTDSTVQILNAETGSVIKKLLPLKENRSTAGDQNVQILAISGDGRFMAASIAGAVYVWNCKTEKLLFSKGPGHKLVSGLAFSPDSKFLATSDTRQGGVIKIWRVSKH
ncbi:MAG: PQQ-binding-like beta-propeller repeat protein [Planctomycetota bacterium]